MGIVSSSVVDAPPEEVFAWHGRPGALTRLSPPWQPVRVLDEAASLRDGRATLGLPGGLRWVACHEPGGYDPPHRFVDVLGPASVGKVLRWRHEHVFEPYGATRTRLTDRVESPVPERLLGRMFGYRQRQLADDLASQRWAASQAYPPSTIAVTGTTGVVGTALVAFLRTAGHDVVCLVRHPPRGPWERRWSPEDPAENLLDGVDAVVHLAGAGIAGRFTEAHKRGVLDSRVGPTARLAERAAAAGVDAFVAASAIGFYGPDRGDEVLTEASPRGGGFLADVVARWEAASAPAEQAGVRVVHVRTGIVQTPRGGTLRLYRPLFSAGLGGPLGAGDDWLSWIGIDDLVDVYQRALVDRSLVGAVNAVAPQEVTTADYARTLGRVLRRPARLRVPAAAPQVLLGREGASELARTNQRVRPQGLLDVGHRFRHPDLEPALRHLLGRMQS